MAGCSSPSVNSWEQMVPGDTFAIIPVEPQTDIRDLLAEPYIPLLDDMTPSAIQLASSLVTDESSVSIFIHAMLLYPDTSTDWQPVWIADAPDGTIESLQNRFSRKYQQNSYQFMRHTIRKVFVSDRVLFFTNIGKFTVFSESSIAIEGMIQTISGNLPPLSLPMDSKLGDIIINTPQLSILAQQNSAIMNRPFLQGLSDGTSAMSMTFLPGEKEREWKLHGISAVNDQHDDFIRLLIAEPASFRLHRYIPINIAAFGLFRNNPVRFVADSVSSGLPADDFLKQNQSALRTLKNSLGSEVAIAMFSESGPASDSEYLFLREISNPEPIRNLLQTMADGDMAIQDGQTFSITSEVMGSLLGSSFYPDGNFYLVIYDEVAAFATRKGLVESVGSDAQRRRVIFYDDDYRSMMQSFDQPLSSIFYADANQFSTYVQPWLYPQHQITPLLNQFDQLVIATKFNSSTSSVEFTIKNFERDEAEEPYVEQWVYPLNNADLTGTPVFANITGTERQEIIFSTNDGSVFIIAADGTTILQTSTNTDVPTGPPIVYDWYGNNQPVIMQAASNKIYAWNKNGGLLPNFPITLSEDISTPLTVQDLLANGVPEIVVATADRNLHLLNTRGLPVSGWPQSTNSVINSKPLIADLDGEKSIFAFSENTLHSWSLNGRRRDGFPIFLPSQINGSPVLAGSHLLGAGLDGDLYAVGSSALFSDTLSTKITTDSLIVESIQISNSGLSGSPVFEDDVMIRSELGLVRDDVILIQSGNGSVFLYSLSGDLILTQTMGQPASSKSTPFFADINSDDRLDVVATASFGRIYSWDLLSGERHLDLPTAAMEYPAVFDFDENGFSEIITQTRDGLQTWTIFFTRRDTTESAQ